MGTMTNGKALIVDDSKVVQFKLKRMLEARGMGVDTAGSGEEALDFLKSHAPDVIFMDCMMPGLDGYEATGIIKANPRTAAIPVIMCTGHDTPEDRARARETGANGYVVKPFDDAVLDDVLVNLRKGALGAVQGAIPATVASAYVDTSPAPLDAPLSVADSAPEVPAPVMAADTSLVAERIAREVAEKLIREAMADLSAASEQVSRDVAQQAATRAIHDAMESWRAEVAQQDEGARLAAIAAATQAAGESVQSALNQAEAVRRSEAMAAEDKLREALATANATAERVAREALDAGRAAMQDGSRELLASARADLDQSARIAAEAAAKPVAETSARVVAEQLLQAMLATAHEEQAVLRTDVQQSALAAAEQITREMVQRSTEAAEAARSSAQQATEAKLQEALSKVHATAEDMVRVSLARVNEDAARLRTDLEQASVTVAERVARELVQQAVDTAEVARQSTAMATQEKLQQALASVPATAEHAAREALDLARAGMEDSSRETLASLRAELLDSVRPAAEAAARAVAEEVVRAALALAHEEQVAWRNRIEESAVAVAQRVGGELVKLAFEAAQASRQAVPVAERVGQPDVSTTTDAKPIQVTRGDLSRAEAHEMPTSAPSVPESLPPAWSSRPVLLPWLAGLTLAVLYLVFKSF